MSIGLALHDRDMHRRDALRAGSGLLGASLAGCLGSLEGDSAWRDLVIDRPNEVYVPPKIDGMARWGTESAGDYVVSLFATRPHRFWTVTGHETTQIAMREDHSVHLMASVREPATGHHVPAEVVVSIRRGGDSVVDRTLWPMLSQRMGVHHGDNVTLPGDGVYTAAVRVVPEALLTSGGVEDGSEPATVDVEFEYEVGAIDALDRTILEERRRGRPGAVEPMGSSGGHASHDAAPEQDGFPHPPVPTAPPPDSLPGTVVVDEADGCEVAIAVLPTEGGDGAYLAVSPRTPYNRFPLTRASLSVVPRDGRGRERLYPALDSDLGNHYGRVVDPVGPGEELTIAFDSPPQLARHEGYETAFLDAPAVTPSFPP